MAPSHRQAQLTKRPQTHRRPKARRAKSAGALLLLPLLFSFSEGTVHTASVAAESVIPQVPTRSYEQPASVQPAVTVNTTQAKAIAKASPTDIPAVALAAYRRTETLLSDADPECNISWALVAAIGRVESDHGRTGGNTLDSQGFARPGIYGIPLDGTNNTATIRDTDEGKLDKDRRWDRAVGPMQFIPGTWASVAVDSDNDGKSDPQDIFDATAAAGVYLCAGVDDLATDAGARNAVLRYNHSDSYVNKVLAIAAKYASGSFDTSSNFYAAPSSQALLVPAVPVIVPDATPIQEPKPSAAKPSRSGSNSGPGTVPVTPPVVQEPVDQPTEEVPPTVPTDEEPPAIPSEEEPTVPSEEEPPVVPPGQFAGTEVEARDLCFATGAYLADSIDLQACILALMQTGFLPVPPATPPTPDQ